MFEIILISLFLVIIYLIVKKKKNRENNSPERLIDNNEEIESYKAIISNVKIKYKKQDLNNETLFIKYSETFEPYEGSNTLEIFTNGFLQINSENGKKYSNLQLNKDLIEILNKLSSNENILNQKSCKNTNIIGGYKKKLFINKLNLGKKITINNVNCTEKDFLSKETKEFIEILKDIIIEGIYRYERYFFIRKHNIYKEKIVSFESLTEEEEIEVHSYLRGLRVEYPNYNLITCIKMVESDFKYSYNFKESRFEKYVEKIIYDDGDNKESKNIDKNLFF